MVDYGWTVAGPGEESQELQSRGDPDSLVVDVPHHGTVEENLTAHVHLSVLGETLKKI